MMPTSPSPNRTGDRLLTAEELAAATRLRAEIQRARELRAALRALIESPDIAVCPATNEPDQGNVLPLNRVPGVECPP